MSNNENEHPFAESYWQQDGGSKWAEFIDETEKTLSVYNSHLLEAANLQAGFQVLDVGCGGAVNSMAAAELVGESGSVTGVDISGPILEVSQSRISDISNLQLIEADAATHELVPQTYDRIISRFGVMFFSDPVLAFINFKQALKTDGKMVYICWRPMDLNEWMFIPTQAVMSVVPPAGPPPEPTAPGPFSMQDKTHTEGILKKAGFTSVSFESIDVHMDLGTVDRAVDYFMRMGPAASLLVDASDEQKQEARQAVETAMQDHITDGHFVARGAVWLVKGS